MLGLVIVACGTQMLYIGKLKRQTDTSIILETPRTVSYQRRDEKSERIDMGLTPVLPGFNPDEIEVNKEFITWTAECNNEGIDKLYTQVTSGIVLPTEQDTKILSKKN